MINLLLGSLLSAFPLLRWHKNLFPYLFLVFLARGSSLSPSKALSWPKEALNSWEPRPGFQQRPPIASCCCQFYSTQSTQRIIIKLSHSNSNPNAQIPGASFPSSTISPDNTLHLSSRFHSTLRVSFPVMWGRSPSLPHASGIIMVKICSVLHRPGHWLLGPKVMALVRTLCLAICPESVEPRNVKWNLTAVS